MLALERIVAQNQRREEDLLGEAVAGAGPAIVAGGGGDVVKNIVHAAEFFVEDVLHVLFGFRCGPGIDPAGHFDDYIEGLIVAGLRLHVVEPGHDFVHGVKRRPDLFALVEPVKYSVGKALR